MDKAGFALCRIALSLRAVLRGAAKIEMDSMNLISSEPQVLCSW